MENERERGIGRSVNQCRNLNEIVLNGIGKTVLIERQIGVTGEQLR